ncbi:MAG: sugar phosphate isomerase/epimerase family protein [Thermoproteota archaeon]
MSVMFCVKANVGGKLGYFEFPYKVGIVGFMAYPSTLKNYSLLKAFNELFSDPFFELIEYSFLEEEEWNKVKEVVNKNKKEISLALQPFTFSNEGELSSLNEERRTKAVNEVKRRIKISAGRNVRTIGLTSGQDPGEEKRRGATEQLIKSLNEICDYAENYGMFVLLETFDRSYDKKLLIGPIEEAKNVVDEVRKNHKNIGILWDLSHAPMLGETPSVLLKYKEIVSHIHIGCTKSINGTMKDWHPSFYREGALNDINNVVELLEVLNKINYRGAISFEVKPEEGQHPQEAINVSKGVLITAFLKYLEKNPK